MQSSKQTNENSSKIIWVWSLISTFILWVHSLLYSQFLSDDALISMRYAERLLEGKGLTWTDGIPVEGYSNLLWVLLTSALGAFGLDLVDAVRVLGFVFNASVIFAIAYLFKKYQSQFAAPLIQGPLCKSIIPLVIAQFFWVFSGSTAVWTMGGLEQPLVVAGLVWACVILIPTIHKSEIEYKNILLSSLGLTAVVLTRPDGPLFTVILCLTWWIFRPKTLNNFIAGIILGLIPFIAFAAQMGFRIHTYGDYVPNTAHVKAVVTKSRIISGIRYTISALSTTSPFIHIIFFGTAYTLYKKRNATALSLALIPAAVWLVYISSVGGDIFPAFRHGLVVYGLMSIALLIIFINAMPLLEQTTPVWLQWCLIALCFIPFAITQIEHPENKEAFYEKWEWDGQAVGETLHAAFHKQQPLYAVTAAGSLPYWSKLPSLDMLGLNDHHIARNPPETFGHGELGHDLGDGQYTLDQKPGLISFCGPYGSLKPCRLGGKQMIKTKEFHRYYQPLFIDIMPTNGRPAFTNIQWVRWQDSPIGIQETNSTVIIPGYLAATSESNAALLKENSLITQIVPEEALKFPIPESLSGLIMDTNIYLNTSEGEMSLLNAGVTLIEVKPNNIKLFNKGTKAISVVSIIIKKPASAIAAL